MAILELAHGDLRLALDPALGGALLSFRKGDVDLLRPTPAGASDVLETACFPLVPYANRIADGRFVPTGGVEGDGALCSEYERETGQRGHPGWMELANGVFHGDETGRAPQSPYIHGCLDASGRFRPDSRDVVP